MRKGARNGKKRGREAPKTVRVLRKKDTGERTFPGVLFCGQWKSRLCRGFQSCQLARQVYLPPLKLFEGHF